eukprot:2336068-Alexandrium_andersonii.AAC.1
MDWSIGITSQYSASPAVLIPKRSAVVPCVIPRDVVLCGVALGDVLMQTSRTLHPALAALGFPADGN